MATNDFIGFASAGLANVMSQADYAAAAEQADGVQPGPASSALANKVWRQGANMAAAIGEMIKAQGIDALDNGDIATLSNNLVSALSAFLLPLSGGVMTGDIIFNSALNNIRAADNEHSLSFFGGASAGAANGAKFYLNGADNTDSGTFIIQAGNSSGYKQLIGNPNGTLTWDGKDIATYETGTWTPTLYGSSTAGTIKNTQNSSYYIKLKDLVYVRFYFSWKITTAPAGEVRMGGLPYTPSSYYHGMAGCNTHICNYVNTVQNTSYARVSAYTPTTSVGSGCNWGTGSNTYNNWNNAVNATDSLLGWLLYSTIA